MMCAFFRIACVSHDPKINAHFSVDECGCTTESSVALLMRMHPKNLIMVGDHKQLPPTSLIPPKVNNPHCIMPEKIKSGIYE